MNPIYTAMRLANLILEISARNTNFLEHFKESARREIREAIRDHEDALVQRQVDDARPPTKRLCPQCAGSGFERDGEMMSSCMRCLGTGWEEL